jgi:predicted Zn finger-like uncharacterized protein
MLTQCPECKTTFRLHVSQLKAAAGKVRCSRCDTTFNALDHLFEPSPPAEAPLQVDTPQPVTEPLTEPGMALLVQTAEENEESAAPVTTPPEEEDALSTFIEDLEGATTTPDETTDDLFGETFTTEEGEEPDDTTYDLFGELFTIEDDEEPDDTTDDLLGEAFTTGDVEEPDDTTDDLFGETFTIEDDEKPDETTDNLFVDAFTIEDVEEPDDTTDDLFGETFTTGEVDEPDDTLPDGFTTIFEETVDHEATIEEPLTNGELPDALLDEVEPEIDTPYDALPAEEEEETLKEASSYAAEELDLADENTATGEGTTPPDELPQIEAAGPLPAVDYTLPAELTQARQGSGATPLLWGVGVILMCALLALQYLYYQRLQLVENPQLRPLLTTLCKLGGCQLPPRRDLGRIELSDHLMQFHPNHEQSLLLGATLVNRAGFAQPYPLVEVVMTDIEQQVVARRRFSPAQYLPSYRDGDSFAANSEVALLLEVLDPGNQAVGFEFRFY